MTKTRTFRSYYRSPLGWLKVEGAGPSLKSVEFVSKNPPAASPALPPRVRRELDQYFTGKRRKFSLGLRPSGTVFQKRVWNALRRIPYGRSVSYAGIASRLGRPKSVRAVAGAIGRNRIAVVIPCHRVIGSDGSLTGYAYGLRKKAWLLSHERLS